MFGSHVSSGYQSTNVSQQFIKMPLHRDESSGRKTLNFKGKDQTCFVKEHNHLSRERTTVMTIVSSANKIKTCIQRNWQEDQSKSSS